MDSNSWKHLERKTAKLTDGKRAHFQPLDVEHDNLVIECKYREKLAVWSWLKTLEKKAGSKMPVLVLKEKGKHGELAVIKLDTLLELLKIKKTLGIDVDELLKDMLDVDELLKEFE